MLSFFSITLSEGTMRMGMSGLECAAGTSVAGSLRCCKVELAAGCKLEPVPSPMACTPWGACSSGTLSISSSGLCLSPLGLQLSPLWPSLLALQKSTARTLLLFSSSASNSCTCGQRCVAGVLQKQLPLTYLPLTMSRFFVPHLFWMKHFLRSCLKAGLF